MSDTPKCYWFHAKRYGWGWGLPATWQGWIVLLVWVAIFAAGTYLFASNGNWIALGIFIAAMSVALVAICFLKGEPPRWRWGDE